MRLARMGQDLGLRDAAFTPFIERWSRATGRTQGGHDAAVRRLGVHSVVAGGSAGLQPGPAIIAVDPHRTREGRDRLGRRRRRSLIRTFEGDFAAEAFFPDGRRVIGMTGSEVVVRDVATGAIDRAMADAGWPGLRPGEGPESLLPPQCLPRRRAEPVREPRRPLGGGLRAAPWERYSACRRRSSSSTPDRGGSAAHCAVPSTGPATPRAARPLGWRSTPRAACSRWRPPGISPSTRFPRASRSARRRWPGPISRLLVRPLRMEACRSSRCPPASRSRREARDCTWPRTRAMRTVTPSPE